MKSYLKTLLLLLIAACQPLPMPFQPEKSEKLQNKLTQPNKRLGILITPVQGINEKTAIRLAQLTAQEFLKRKILAYSGVKSVHSKIVFGRANLKGNASPPNDILLTWYLAQNISDRNPKKIAEMVLPSESLRNSSNRLRDIARFVAKQMARVEVSTDVPSKSRADYQASLFVWPLTGEKSFMGKQLRDQMRESLRKNYYRVPDKLVPDALVLLGTISIKDKTSEIKEVLIDWSLLDQEGTELGKLHQRNEVTLTNIKKTWGKVAKTITEEASKGLITILNHITAKTNSVTSSNFK